jgi:hypothetical protein
VAKSSRHIQVLLLLAAGVAQAAFGEESTESENAYNQAESPFCVAGRMAIAWSSRVGTNVGMPDFSSKALVVVNQFGATRSSGFNRPKRVDRRTWKTLQPSDTAPPPSSCEALDDLDRPMTFVDQLDEAKPVVNAVVITFNAARIATDGSRVALRFGVTDFQNQVQLNGVLVPGLEDGTWKLNPQTLAISHVQ